VDGTFNLAAPQYMSLPAAATSGMLHALAALALLWSLPPQPIETYNRAIDVTLERVTPPPAEPEAKQEPPKPEPALEATIPSPEPPPVVEAAEFPPPPSLPQRAAEPQPPQEVAQAQLEDALPPVDEPPPFSTREIAVRPPPRPAPKPAPTAVHREPVQQASAPRESERRAQEDYLLQVLQKLSRYRYYPKSRETSEQGMVVTRVTVARDGRVLDVGLAKSSGFPTLDRGVMDAIRQASPFAPLPAEVAGSQMSFIVPVSYSRER
jgi:periplasmic protein TonB